VSITIAEGWRARARADSPRKFDAGRRAFLDGIPRELNSAGFRQADLPERDHQTLRGWLQSFDVLRAERELVRLRHRLPMRASALQERMLDGIERGAILAAAHRLGLRIERVAPGSVDGVVLNEPAQKAPQPGGFEKAGSYLRLAKHLPKTHVKRSHHGNPQNRRAA